ncbi:MAG: DUF945 domain-containing protein [Thermoplasmata archaeon]|nr:DUF945 domain-containing protein [Thermoplasmata archaeon]
MVPVRGPGGDVLDAYRGVQRDDTHEVVSVVSARYGLVGHRDVARAVHQVGKALEVPDSGTLVPAFPRESIRLYSGGRRMEVKLVVGRRFHLGAGEELYPGLRVLNSLDGSWAVRLSGFAVRLACQNQLYAECGNVLEWRELHLSSEFDLLGQLEKAIHEFLGRFQDGLGLYTRAMGQEMLASDVESALLRQGIPRRHAESIGGRAEAEASHVATLSRWAAYQVATAYLTREVNVNPDRERFFEKAAARALLLHAGPIG